MNTKSIVRLPVEDKHNGCKTFIPVGIAEGKRTGPALAVLAGVHGTEYASQEGVARFWQTLDTNLLSGTVYVVLAADVEAVTNHRHHNVINPIDRKNLNRLWPGKPDGTLTEVIAHTLTKEVVTKADVVIDCHGGEFDEAIDMWLLTHSGEDTALNKKTLNLAMAVGMPFVIVSKIDAIPWPGAHLATSEAMKIGRLGVTLEVGGLGLREERHVSAIQYSIENALRYLGMKTGDLIPWAGSKPVRIKDHIRLTPRSTGLYSSRVAAGTWIEKGDIFGVVRDFDGSVLEEILAPESGIALDVVVARAIKEGTKIGDIGTIT